MQERKVNFWIQNIIELCTQVPLRKIPEALGVYLIMFITSHRLLIYSSASGAG